MISDDLLAHLESKGLGIRGETLFRGSMPDKPEECCALYEYGGESPVYSKGGIELRRPRVQIACRSPSYARALQMAAGVYTALAGIQSEVLGSPGTAYERIRALQEPFADPAGRDDKNRALIRCNYAIRKQF